MKYTGFCQNDSNVQGQPHHVLGVGVDGERLEAGHGDEEPDLGFGCILALYYRQSTLYQIR